MKVAITADKIKYTSIIYFFLQCLLSSYQHDDAMFIYTADALKAYRARVYHIRYANIVWQSYSPVLLCTTCTFVKVFSGEKGFNGTLSQSKGVRLTSIHKTLFTL